MCGSTTRIPWLFEPAKANQPRVETLCGAVKGVVKIITKIGFTAEDAA